MSYVLGLVGLVALVMAYVPSAGAVELKTREGLLTDGRMNPACVWEWTGVPLVVKSAGTVPEAIAGTVPEAIAVAALPANAAAIWMNLSGSMLANYWNKRPVKEQVKL